MHGCISTPRCHFNLYGLPIADFRPMRALVIAICAQTAFILAVAGYLFFAGAMLSTSLAMLVWRWTALGRTAFDRTAAVTLSDRSRSILLCAFAILFTVLALIPWVAAKSNDRNTPAHKPALITHESKDTDTSGSDYVGIILWPPPTKNPRSSRPGRIAPRSKLAEQLNRSSFHSTDNIGTSRHQAKDLAHAPTSPTEKPPTSTSAPPTRHPC